MKELSLHEMENISGAGLFDLPCALVNFGIQTGLNIAKAGIQVGFCVATSLLEVSVDFATNSTSNNPSSLDSILENHLNSFDFAASGIWSNFMADVSTSIGAFTYSVKN